ncbi:hypothetical protein JCM5296_002501 [Sporobolomyces johnsonii]
MSDYPMNEGYGDRYDDRAPPPSRSPPRGARSSSNYPPPARPSGAPVPEPSNVLGVFGLSIRTYERDLEAEFSRSGRVEKVVVVYDQRSGRSRGFGFVTMGSVQDAEKAIADLNGMELHGRRLRVDFSATVRPHDPTPGEYRGPRRDDEWRAAGPAGPGAWGDRWASRAYGGGGGDRYGSGGGRYRDDDRYASSRREDDRYASSSSYRRSDRDRDYGRDYDRRDHDRGDRDREDRGARESSRRSYSRRDSRSPSPARGERERERSRSRSRSPRRERRPTPPSPRRDDRDASPPRRDDRSPPREERREDVGAVGAKDEY